MENQEHSKTEEATPFRLEDARKKGMVARGLDVGVLFTLVTVIGYFWVDGPALAKSLAQAASHALVDAPQLAVSNAAVWVWLAGLGREVCSALAPLFGAIVLAGFLAGFVQVRLLFAPAALKPDFSKLNPANGFKRVFSIATLLETAKASFKFAVYAALATWIIAEAIPTALQVGTDPHALLDLIWKQATRLMIWFALAALIFAALDQALVRWQFGQKMRMSRSDIRDELRHREGDPRIRQRRRQLQRELLKRSKSMRQVRDADLLVTNPTHYAIALSYDAKIMSAPKIVARGSGDFALRLKRVAFIYRVPVLENAELARGLFHEGLLDHEIPSAFIRPTAKLYIRMRELSMKRAT